MKCKYKLVWTRDDVGNDCATCLEDERRHAVEPDSACLVSVKLHERLDQAARTLDGHLRLRTRPVGHQTLVHRVPPQRDGRVSAHRAVTVVVHEDDANVGSCNIRLDDERAVHVVVSPRLKHEEPAVAVQVFTNVIAFLQQGGTVRPRESRLDDSHGLSTGVHLCRPDGDVVVKIYGHVVWHLQRKCGRCCLVLCDLVLFCFV